VRRRREQDRHCFADRGAARVAVGDPKRAQRCAHVVELAVVEQGDPGNVGSIADLVIGAPVEGLNPSFETWMKVARTAVWRVTAFA